MTVTNNNPCKGCQQGLPMHLGQHIAECEYLPCTRPQFALEPLERDVWHQPQKKSLKSVPFVCGGST